MCMYAQMLMLACVYTCMYTYNSTKAASLSSVIRLDFAAAFETVNHQIHISSLWELGVQLIKCRN